MELKWHIPLGFVATRRVVAQPDMPGQAEQINAFVPGADTAKFNQSQNNLITNKQILV